MAADRPKSNQVPVTNRQRNLVFWRIICFDLISRAEKPFVGKHLSMKLALSMLCENPLRKTGLTTLFHEFVSHSVELFPDLSWVLYAGPNQAWTFDHPRVAVDRRFPANDHLLPRLLADHLRVPSAARDAGAQALVTIGFVPLRKCLPTIMHVFSLQHLSRDNRVGFGREFYRRWLMKFSWPKADLIITNSDFARSQLLSVHPDFKHRLVRSYEGLQHDQFHSQPDPGEAKLLLDKLGLKPGYFLWISNFYPYKQADLLLEGYARMPLELRQAHPLVMVGGDWEGVLERLRARVTRLGLDKHVIFPGWVEDAWLAPLYRHAQAFCLASREETFGRCVIEAMACGTPCVVNDIPIMHEVTRRHALIVDFRDASAVANALREVVENQALRERLRREGISGTLRFNFDVLARERIEAIGQLLGQASSGENVSRG